MIIKSFKKENKPENFYLPKVSVITVVKNNQHYLEQTIKSVINQSYPNIEYIVIDSNSTDNTNNIVRKYEKFINIYLRQFDRSLWEAMNKGIKVSSGSIVCFLNSDDIFEKKAVQYAVKYLKDRKTDFVFGSVFKHFLKHGFKPKIAKFSFSFYTTHSIGFFVKKKVHDYIGYYNKNFLSADLDFFLRIILSKKYNGVGTQKKELFGYFRPGGFSSKIKYRNHLEDLNNIRIKNGQNKLLVYLIYIYKIIKNIKKFVLNSH